MGAGEAAGQGRAGLGGQRPARLCGPLRQPRRHSLRVRLPVSTLLSAARVKHPNILQLVDVFVTRKEYFIFLEL